MKSYQKIGVMAVDLYHILSFEGFTCYYAHNKRKITYSIPHDIGDPLPDPLVRTLRGLLRGWLRDHFPDLPSGYVSELVNESPKESLPGSVTPLVIRESWNALNIVIHIKRVREAEQKALTHKRAREVGNMLLQNRDVYGDTLSVRDIQYMSHAISDDALSYRQSIKVMKLLETKHVAKKNGNLKTQGRDLNYAALKKFLSTT